MRGGAKDHLCLWAAPLCPPPLVTCYCRWESGPSEEGLVMNRSYFFLCLWKFGFLQSFASGDGRVLQLHLQAFEELVCWAEDFNWYWLAPAVNMQLHVHLTKLLEHWKVCGLLVSVGSCWNWFLYLPCGVLSASWALGSLDSKFVTAIETWNCHQNQI